MKDFQETKTIFQTLEEKTKTLFSGSGFENLDDEIKQEEKIKDDPILDSDGKEIKADLRTISQAVLFFISIAGICTCAAIRGCQEFKKEKPTTKKESSINPKDILRKPIFMISDTHSKRNLPKVQKEKQ